MSFGWKPVGCQNSPPAINEEPVDEQSGIQIPIHPPKFVPPAQRGIGRLLIKGAGLHAILPFEKEIAT